MLGAILLVAVGMLGLLWILQRRLIYFPTGQVPGVGAVLPGAEEVVIPTADGLELSGWLVPPAGDDTGFTVVVCNGNAGNRSYRVPLAEALAARGYRVLLFDYRGYGGNPGSPSESGLAEDARAVVDYLAGLKGVDRARLVYFGESLGAAVAVDLAVEHPPASLVLRSPFTSLVDMASTHYPFVPASLLLWDRFDNQEKMPAVMAPVLVVAGSDDRIVPTEQSRRVYEAGPDPKRLVVIEGADHNDYSLLAGEELIDAVVSFLQEHDPGG